MRSEKHQLHSGDLVEIYAPLSKYHGFYALVLCGPNTLNIYNVLIQEDMIQTRFAFNELRRIN
jgi:hypothetical protein